MADPAVLPSLPERPLTRQEREDALGKSKRGVHMMKNPIKLKTLRDDNQNFKKFCDAEIVRLDEEEGQATDPLDKLAIIAEKADCAKAIKSADAALLAIENRVQAILSPKAKTESKADNKA